MRTLPAVAATLLTYTLGFPWSALAGDDDNKRSFAARLSSYNEVHFSGGGGAALPVPAATLRGAISTAASGTFKARIDDHHDVIHYELSFEGLESDVTQAHIHFGQRHTVGGIVVWLCQAVARAPAAVAALTPECGGPRANTVTGTITPAQVLDVTGQGIAAGEFEELLRAIRAGATYANVHSVTFGPGEVRGQLRGRGNHDRH